MPTEMKDLSLRINFQISKVNLHEIKDKGVKVFQETSVRI